MSRATPHLRIFARRLIAFERRGAKPAGPLPGFMVCDRLRPQLVTLMGAAGFRALLSRALAMSGAEIVWLRDLQVKKDGTLMITEEQAAKIPPPRRWPKARSSWSPKCSDYWSRSSVKN